MDSWFSVPQLGERRAEKGLGGWGQDSWFLSHFSIGCELHPNDTLRRFCDAGMNSEDFLSFDTDNGKWVTRRGDKLTLKAQESLNYNRVVAESSPLPHPVSLVSERPVAVVFARVPPPAGTPTPVLLVCRVTGFYPRPVRVAWLQDGEEVVLGWWLNSSEILPNADLTYQLRSSLAVEPGAGHSYACRVQHSSLGGQSLLIPWGRCTSWSLGAFPASYCFLRPKGCWKCIKAWDTILLHLRSALGFKRGKP
uniref:Ig-like domain-containing protein n=1 Tax=Chelonoidis abingdonii TaxID=106734 RepID=A0A8C0G6Q1_CHEAB